MDAILYIRWSTKDQSEGDSRTRQTRLGEQIAKRHGWLITETLIDHGKSAYHGPQGSKRYSAEQVEQLKALANKTTLQKQDLTRLEEAQFSSAEPIWFQLQLQDAQGYPQSLAGRSFTFRVYELNGAPKAAVAGVARHDATGTHLLFNVGGRTTAKWPDQHDLRWEISETRGDGALQLLSGQMIVLRSSSTSAGDSPMEPALMPRIERGDSPGRSPTYRVWVRNVPRADQLPATA